MRKRPTTGHRMREACPASPWTTPLPAFPPGSLRPALLSSLCLYLILFCGVPSPSVAATPLPAHEPPSLPSPGEQEAAESIQSRSTPELLELLRQRTGGQETELQGTELERELAALELGDRTPPEALPVLIQALREDGSSRVRQAAALALGGYQPPPPPALEALMEVLAGRDPHLKSTVAAALARLGREHRGVVEALAGVLGSENPRQRQAAAIVLERIGPPAQPALPAVIRLLRRDPVERVRRFAVAALTAMGEGAREAAPALARAAREDGSERIRQYAAEALPRVGAPAGTAVPVLMEALGDGDWGVRAAAARALGSYGPDASAAVPALKEARKDGEEAVREAAKEALGAVRKGG